MDAPRDISIRLVPGPIHYDFLLPLTPEARAVFADLGDTGPPVAHPGAAWLIVGWGSEAFYTNVGTYRDLTPGIVWRAATGDRSVLRLETYGGFEPAGWTREVTLSAREYSRLLEAIAGTLSIGPSGAPILLHGPVPGRSGWFFATEPRFHLFRTCNTWISAILRAAGLRFGAWTPVPYAVRLSHALHLR